MDYINLTRAFAVTTMIISIGFLFHLKHYEQMAWNDPVKGDALRRVGLRRFRKRIILFWIGIKVCWGEVQAFC